MCCDNIGCELPTTMKDKAKDLYVSKIKSLHLHTITLSCFSFSHRSWFEFDFDLILFFSTLLSSWMVWMQVYVCVCVCCFLVLFIWASYRDSSSSQACNFLVSLVVVWFFFLLSLISNTEPYRLSWNKKELKRTQISNRNLYFNSLHAHTYTMISLTIIARDIDAITDHNTDKVGSVLNVIFYRWFIFFFFISHNRINLASAGMVFFVRFFQSFVFFFSLNLTVI